MREKREKQSSGKQNGFGSYVLLFLLAFSLLFGGIGGGIVYFAHRQEISGTAAEGVVLEYETRSPAGERREYSPVIEYQAGGRTFTGRTNAWSTSKPFRTGERVAIGYDPGDPGRFYIREFDLKLRYRLGAVFLSVSIGILLLLTAAAALSAVKMDKEKKDRIKAVLLVLGIVLFILIVFWLLAGPVVTIGLFAAMGLFALYGWYDSRRV